MFTVQWWIQDFPDGGASSWSWYKNLLFGKSLAENCMKIKETGPRGASYLLGSTSAIDCETLKGLNSCQGRIVGQKSVYFVKNHKSVRLQSRLFRTTMNKITKITIQIIIAGYFTSGFGIMASGSTLW